MVNEQSPPVASVVVARIVQSSRLCEPACAKQVSVEVPRKVCRPVSKAPIICDMATVGIRGSDGGVSVNAHRLLPITPLARGSTKVIRQIRAPAV
jgi:hypothetical protein